jgi:hypothetical protein
VVDRGRFKTPGRFSTEVITRDTAPQIQIHYKSSKAKAYLKEGRALRVETTVNNAKDFALHKTLSAENWNALRRAGADTNARFLATLGEGRPGLPDPHIGLRSARGRARCGWLSWGPAVGKVWDFIRNQPGCGLTATASSSTTTRISKALANSRAHPTPDMSFSGLGNPRPKRAGRQLRTVDAQSHRRHTAGPLGDANRGQ